MCKRPPRMCCVVFVVVLLRCCFCCKAITFIYVFAYLAGRQAGNGGGSGACRGCHAAIASFDTEHFLFNFHASHAYPDGALPPLFHSLSLLFFFLIYFRIYLYIFACLVTFYLPLPLTLCPSNPRHFVNSVFDSLSLCDTRY